jgi:hypothetical protein
LFLLIIIDTLPVSSLAALSRHQQAATKYIRMNLFADQLTMTKTFRQQNVRRILEIELRGINKISPKVLSASSISYPYQVYPLLPIFILFVEFSFNRQFCEKKREGKRK